MKKRIWTVDLTILTLGVACAVLAGMLAAVKPMLLLVVVPVLAVMGLLLFWNVNALRKRMAKLLHGSGEKAQSTFASLALPVVVVSGGSIVWYNDAFSQDVLGGGDACLVPAGRVMPGLDEKKAAAKEGQPLRFGGRRWTVYGSRASADEALFVAYLVDDTVLKNRADEYLAARPAVLLIASGGDVRAALVNLIFYALFAPACGQMINRIMYMSEAVMEADEAIGRLDEILSQQPMEEPKVQKRPASDAVAFDHVTFTYPGADRPALEDVSFSVRPGEVVALVGPSGGGKTTAASLIPRFWDVDSGSVTVGGADVRKLDSAALMGQVAFVFQDTRLFKESLLENIRAARPDASREEVLAAAHAAQCDDILEKLPHGLDTVVGARGVYLSGGEQQRIALARAILKDAPIVVLDEATAFADPENEHQIQKAFETLTRNKTVLMIAHRLSTVQNADSIIVLNEGKIAEQGSHCALLEKNGVYAAMWADYQRSAQWKVGKEAAV